MPDQDTTVIRLPEVARRTGLGRSTLYRFMKEGSFPRHFKLGKQASGWLAIEVDAWIASRMASRDGGATA
jgi:prophage regulatory protein